MVKRHGYGWNERFESYQIIRLINSRMPTLLGAGGIGVI
jgi:hypothetical protein